MATDKKKNKNKKRLFGAEERQYLEDNRNDFILPTKIDPKVLSTISLDSLFENGADKDDEDARRDFKPLTEKEAQSVEKKLSFLEVVMERRNAIPNAMSESEMEDVPIVVNKMDHYHAEVCATAQCKYACSSSHGKSDHVNSHRILNRRCAKQILSVETYNTVENEFYSFSTEEKISFSWLVTYIGLRPKTIELDPNIGYFYMVFCMDPWDLWYVCICIKASKGVISKFTNNSTTNTSSNNNKKSMAFVNMESQKTSENEKTMATQISGIYIGHCFFICECYSSSSSSNP
jgi:hypothetical protein